MTRTKKSQPKKKLISQKGKMSAKEKSNKKSLNSKGTVFVTPVSLGKPSAKLPTAKPLSAKGRSAKVSPKAASVKRKVSPKSASNKKPTVNQIPNGGSNTKEDQPALKNAYRKMYGRFG